MKTEAKLKEKIEHIIAKYVLGHKGISDCASEIIVQLRQDTIKEIKDLIRPNWSDHNNYKQNVEASIKSDILTEIDRLATLSEK